MRDARTAIDPSHGHPEPRRLRLVRGRRAKSLSPFFILINGPAHRLQHEPVGASVGLTLQQLREIRLTPPFGSTPKTSLTPELHAALVFADFMSESVKVPQGVFDNIHKFLDYKQMVDAVATVGGYNFVSRFVVALDVDSKANVPVPIPTSI